MSSDLKPRPISKAQAAKEKGCSRPAVTQAISRGTLANAVMADGRLDGNHVDYVRWVRVPPQRLTEELTNAEKEEHAKLRERLVAGEAPEDIAELADWSLHDLIDAFGSVTALNDYLDARKKMADIEEKELKNDRLRAEVVDRSLVVRIFDEVAKAIRNMVTDVPTPIVIEVYAHAANGATTEEATSSVRRILSGEARSALDNATRMLRDTAD